MALKKTIAGYFKESNVDILNDDGSFSHVEKKRDWVDQVDIEMHPLEEESLLKYWALDEVRLPEKATESEEHEWMVEHGIDFVKQKRKEFNELLESKRAAYDNANEAFQLAHNGWNEHVELCVMHGVCPNKYDGDARLNLKKDKE